MAQAQAVREAPTHFINSAVLSQDLFNRFSEYIQKDLGIKMPTAKKTMLQARLQKRLRRLKIPTFEEYYEYVFSNKGQADELHHMIDVVTTNKTDFFREPRHFDYLTQTVLPVMYRNMSKGERSRFRVWSAGCSTGAEPYTLGMVLGEFQARFDDFSFSILATDISTRVLNEAAQGIYTEDDVEPVGMRYKKKYLLRSKDKDRGLVRIVPEIRNRVQFGRLNFMAPDYKLRESVHIVFCRNVIIYFDKPTQEKVLNRLCRYLLPGGYMFMGHSETLGGLKVPLKQVASTIYQRL